MSQTTLERPSTLAPKRRRNWWPLLGFVGAGLAVGALGFVFGKPDAWYRGLDKSPLTPPDWVFGPVWSGLYTLMGVSAWLVWRRRHRPGARRALALFGTQLGLNAIWSPLFFGAHAPRAALADLALMGTAITAYTLSAWQVSRAAAVLFIPYMGWVSFASVLNAEIVRRNPARSGVPGRGSAAEALAAGARSLHLRRPVAIPAR